MIIRNSKLRAHMRPRRNEGVDATAVEASIDRNGVRTPGPRVHYNDVTSRFHVMIMTSSWSRYHYSIDHARATRALLIASSGMEPPAAAVHVHCSKEAKRSKTSRPVRHAGGPSPLERRPPKLSLGSAAVRAPRGTEVKCSRQPTPRLRSFYPNLYDVETPPHKANIEKTAQPERG